MHVQRSKAGIEALQARFYAGVWARIGEEKAMSTNGTVYPQREKVVFPPNTPVRLALKYAQPKIGQSPSGEEYALFTTVDNRVFFMDVDSARNITQLGIRPSQDIDMTMVWSGKRGDPKIYHVSVPEPAPSPQPPAPAYGPQSNGTYAVPRAAAPPLPPAETDMERRLRESIAYLDGLKKEKDANGVHSPAPQTTATSSDNHTPRPPAAEAPRAAGADAWDERIMQLTWKRLELYAALRERAAEHFGGLVDGNTVQAFLMNVLISSERSSQ